MIFSTILSLLINRIFSVLCYSISSLTINIGRGYEIAKLLKAKYPDSRVNGVSIFCVAKKVN